MALQQQELSITFTDGIDTKTDAKLSTKLDSLNNGFIGQTGTIQKRNGFTGLPTDIYLPSSGSGTNIAAGELLVTNGNELLDISAKQAMMYSPALGNKWTSEFGGGAGVPQYQIKLDNLRPSKMFGSCLSMFREETTTEEIFLFNYAIFPGAFDSGFHGILRRDKFNGNIIEDNPESANSWQYNNGQLVKVGSTVIKVTKTDSSIYVQNVTTKPYGSTVNVITDAASVTDLGFYNAFSIGGYLYIAYASTLATVTTVRVKKYDTSFTLLASISFTSADTLVPGFAMELDQSTGNLALVYHAAATLASTQTLYLKIFTTSLSLVSTVTTGTGSTNLAGFALAKSAVWSSAANAVIVFTNENAIYGNYVATYNITGASLSLRNLQVNAKLGSGAYFKDSDVYAVVLKQSNKSNAYISVLMDSYLTYIANVSDYTISLIGVDGAISKCSSDIFPLGSTKNGNSLVKLYSSGYDCSSPKELINKGIFATGGMYEFSSSKIMEPFFVNAPLIISNSVVATVGAVPAGTYEYVAVYEYIDANGQLTESAVSPIYEITIGTASKITFSIELAECSRRANNGLIVQTALYRRVKTTETVFKFVSYTTTDKYATNSTGKALYTTGGVLENTPSVVTNIFTSHADRIFCVDEENKNTVYFSRKMQPGYGLRFNTTVLYFVVNDNKTGFNEKVTGLGSLDDKLIVFKNNSIYAVFGDGPNGLGQGTFSDPKLISTDVGCRDARSIVNSSEGLYFMSNKGIYLLDRSLQVVYIGADVEDYNSLEITGAVLLPKLNQIRFTTRTGVTLVYNYYYKGWSTFTNYESNHSVMWSGSYTHLKSTGLVNVENTGYLDNLSTIQIKIIQSWLKASGVQHLQRMYRMMFIGDWKSSHNVTVNLSYDYENYVWDTYSIVPLSSDYNRTDKPALTALYTGANNGVYQYEIHLARQKCQSIRFEIFDTDVVGESFTLTGLSLIIGIKTGLDKLSSNKKF